ncbi:MAG TPA: DUF1189 domain-containing protein [Enterococcus columbae]|nr:DUF1189 domain-containing protein [Enterococcus columbae]
MIQIIKDSMIHFDRIKEIKKLPFSKLIGYLLLLSLLMAIPLAAQVNRVFLDIKQDSIEIANHLPNFHFNDGKLVLENSQKEGFIYQTDSIIFTFDPEGKRSVSDIASDRLGNVLSAGFSKDKFIVSFPSSELTHTMLGSNQLVIDYDNPMLAQLTGKKIRNEIKNSQFPIWMYLIVIVMVLYPSFVNLAITLFTVTLIANIYSHLLRYKNGFIDNLKIMIACASLPVILALLINTFIADFDSNLFITLGSFFIFTQAIKDEQKLV